MLTFQLNDADPATQALKAGDHVTDQFDVTFVDQHGAPTTKHIVVDITGSNDPPVTEGDKTVAFDSNDTARSICASLSDRLRKRSDDRKDRRRAGCSLWQYPA